MGKNSPFTVRIGNSRLSVRLPVCTHLVHSTYVPHSGRVTNHQNHKEWKNFFFPLIMGRCLRKTPTQWSIQAQPVRQPAVNLRKNGSRSTNDKLTDWLWMSSNTTSGKEGEEKRSEPEISPSVWFLDWLIRSGCERQGKRSEESSFNEERTRPRKYTKCNLICLKAFIPGRHFFYQLRVC